MPVLGSIKHDNLRWVFAASLGHFSEAIVHYVANEVKQQNPGSAAFSLSSFSSDFFPAYEILYSNWLQSKETKVGTLVVGHNVAYV
jgi:hypothetical protein